MTHVLHLVLGQAPRPAALAAAAAEAAAGATVHVLCTPGPDASPPGVTCHPVVVDDLPRADGPLAALGPWNVRALAQGRELRALPLDAVVAWGWTAVPAAERLAAARGTPLVVLETGALVEGGPPGPRAALEAWATSLADRVLLAREGATERLAAYRRAGEERAPDAARTYDLIVRPEGIPWPLVEGLLLRLERVLIVQGAAPAVWADACGRSRVALLAGHAPGAEDAVRAAWARRALPIVLDAHAARPAAETGPVVTDVEGLPEALARWLGDPAARARRRATGLARARGPAPDPAAVLTAEAAPVAPERPLRVVLNHGGVVAQELAASLAPLGWELRPLLGPGRDPLGAADLLVALPYGDPRGALEAVRRARRAGVPTAFWNVEDPRYCLDPELGPLVLALAREATATFSTTTQLAARYRAEGVEVQYLPNYGRGHFLLDAPVPEAERTVDVLFLGTRTPARDAFLDGLRRGLGDAVRLVARDDVRDPDAVRGLVGAARLGLSFGSLTDADAPQGPVRGEGVTERVLDYPLAWTPVLSDARGHLADLLVPGEEVFVLEDEAAAADQVRALLANPERRARVAAAARRRVLAQHLGRHRVVAIVEALVARGAFERPGARAALEDARARLARPSPEAP